MNFLYRGIAIFRTLVYLELEAYSKPLVYLKSKAYSEHCQTSTMKRFAKAAT